MITKQDIQDWADDIAQSKFNSNYKAIYEFIEWMIDNTIDLSDLGKDEIDDIIKSYNEDKKQKV